MPRPMWPVAVLLLLQLVRRIPTANSHGFLSTPRSRNLVAHEDRVYYPITASDPLPEDCPNCLNRGGTLARCGVMNPGTNEERNYDLPNNALGDSLEANPQQSYSRGEIIEVEVTLTAHHRGHFEFRACPINSTVDVPTQECFDAHPLQFVSDELYGAPPDVNFPERAYVAPADVSNKVYSTNDGFRSAMAFKYRLKLPDLLFGELVLIQWYYVASNSACVHDGYDAYSWPSDWLSGNGDGNVTEWNQQTTVGTGLPPCSDVLPEDGNGLPEQFWNCAEVSITDASPPRLTDGEMITISQKLPDEDEVVQNETISMGSEATPSLQDTQRPHNKTIIGYYASWQWYDRQKLAEPANMDFTKVTRVNFAFFQTNKHGDIWGTDSWADPNLLFGPYNWNPTENDTEYCSWDTPTTKNCKCHFHGEGLIHLAHAAGAEVYPSLGGWSLSDPFPEMAVNEAARMNFAEKCVELIEDYSFDGLDIDWEYPGYEDHSGTPADTENYNLLLRDLRMKLDELGARTGKFYGLTAALPCGTKNIANIDIQTVTHYLTELNLMTYDFFGAWSETTGTNAPLYDQDWGDDDVKDFSVDGCVRKWVAGGARPATINIGLPFYGRSFVNAKGLNEPHEGNDKSMWWADDGSPQYFNIVQNLPGMVSIRHEPTKTQYAYKNTTMGGLVSYDDSQSICDKTEYCLDHSLNGFIIWELSGDLMPDLSTPLLDAVNDKLVVPSLDCATLSYDPRSMESGASADSGPQNGLGHQPTAAPNTQAPTIPLYCPDGATGPRQYNGCSGYYHCVYGDPRGSAILCPRGTMFDENSMLCLQSESVMCSETRSPTRTPSPRPTSPSATTHPSFGPTSSPVTRPPVASINTFYLIGDEGPEGSDTSAESTPASHLLPEVSVEGAASIPGSSALPSGLNSEVMTATSHVSYDDVVPTSESCPDGYTGALPWNDCREYFYCINSVPHLPTVLCERGELFDVDSNACVDASQTSCPPPSSNDLPLVRPTSPKPLPAMSQSTQHIASVPPKEDTRLPPTAAPSSKVPTMSPSMIPTNSPLPRPINIEQPTSLTVSAETFHGSANIDQNEIPLSAPDGHLAETPSKSSASYFWSSSSSSSGTSSTAELVGNAPNDSAMPQNFTLDQPFITIELLLNDSPRDIGWQLLSLDGTVNIAKPTGAYSAVHPNAIVYEGISLHSRLQNPSAGIVKLQWTIMNVKGNGLQGEKGPDGYFKLYANSPSDGKLLAVGSDFGYMDTVGLAVTSNGLFSLLNDSPSMQMASYSAWTPPHNHGSALPQEDIADFRAQTRESLDTAERQPENTGSAVLVPALISLAVIAVVTGLVLFTIAYRRKKTLSIRMATTYRDGESTNFEDESWNVEGGVSPEEEYYMDYYDTRDDQHTNFLYSDDNASDIDPPGSSFDGYEAKPHATRPPSQVSQSDDYDDNSYLATGLSTNRISAHNPTDVSVERNQSDDLGNIDELLGATNNNLEQTFDTDIYSILEKLERDVV